jgi:hypothetical protein
LCCDSAVQVDDTGALLTQHLLASGLIFQDPLRFERSVMSRTRNDQ